MSIKKKVAIVFTGGTISMTVDDKVGAGIAAPTLSSTVIDIVPPVKTMATFFLILILFSAFHK